LEDGAKEPVAVMGGNASQVHCNINTVLAGVFLFIYYAFAASSYFWTEFESYTLH
jgi:hypothetical protein